MMPPWIISTSFRLFGQYDGFAFFVFIFFYRGVSNRAQLINHERIHFWQQVELLFIGHWFLYGLFYILHRAKGFTHNEAYLAIPFEREAYKFESDMSYLNKRRIFAWAFLK